MLARVMPASVPRAATIDLDWHVVAFTFAVSVVAGLLFGATPALTVARTGESARLKDASRSATSGLGRVRLRGLLVVSEVALSMVLLVGAGLLVRSLIALRSVAPGFDVQHVLTGRSRSPPARIRTGHRSRVSSSAQWMSSRHCRGKRGRRRYRAFTQFARPAAFHREGSFCSLSARRQLYGAGRLLSGRRHNRPPRPSVRFPRSSRIGTGAWSLMKPWLASTFLAKMPSDNKSS